MEFFKGFLLGMTLQLSLGPVFFAVLHKALTEGRSEALKMVTGAAFIDALYIGLSFTGIVVLLQLKTLQSAVLLFGALILICFGLRYIKKARSCKKQDLEWINKNQSRITDGKNGAVLRKSSFIYGLKLTAVNPLTIIFWSGIFGALMAAGTLGSINEALVYAAGCVSATFLFLGTVSIVAPLARDHINKRLEKFFDYFVGIVLIFFGIFMLYKLFNLIFLY